MSDEETPETRLQRLRRFERLRRLRRSVAYQREESKYNDFVHMSLYSDDGRTGLGDYMNEQFSLPANNRFDYLHVFQRISDFFGQVLLDANCNARQEDYASKQLWLDKRKEYIRLMHATYWDLYAVSSFTGNITFEAMYNVFLDCEERFGGIVLTNDGSTTRVLCILPMPTVRYPNPAWTYPKGKRNNYHEVGCRCRFERAHYRLLRSQNLNHHIPISREEDFDCAVREINEETGVNVTVPHSQRPWLNTITMHPYLPPITFWVLTLDDSLRTEWLREYNNDRIRYDTREVAHVAWISVRDLFRPRWYEQNEDTFKTSSYVRRSAGDLEWKINELGFPWNVEN